MTESERRRVTALVVRQWLPDWDQVDFDPSSLRRKPEPHFYLFSLSASDLKALTGINRRSADMPRTVKPDHGIQRRHDEKRSDEIRRFVERGYPWSTLSRHKRDSGEYEDLVKPGWLPTAIVLNILLDTDERQGRTVDRHDLIDIRQPPDGGLVEVVLPIDFSGQLWQPSGYYPLEVIDGQHRLWAFTADANPDFEFPVVAFHGLDLGWQAYLFYIINIKPTRINTSLAYDLYPMLRTADWLERAEEHVVYRETRAQELTESLWSHPSSPWYQRINMLGDPGRKQVTQAAWIRSLIATFVKPWEGRGIRGIGGLFGAPVGQTDQVLGWDRSQQAALLIHVWRCVEASVAATQDPWANSLRSSEIGEVDPAFAGEKTLLNTDQGVRGVLAVVNDLCWVRADELELSDWEGDVLRDDLAEDPIADHLDAVREQPVGRVAVAIAGSLASYDWRTSAAEGLTEEEQQAKARFRGSTGYREIRRSLLRHLAGSNDDLVAGAAREVIETLGY